MSTQTASYLEAIEQLAEGETTQFYGVTWEEYEQLLAELGPGYRVRIAYDSGRLEIMSPLLEHGEYQDTIMFLIREMTRTLGWKLETRGSATLRRQLKAKGIEPDGCYWVRNANHLIGRRDLDFENDPPPDIAVEIDLTHKSWSKFPIYAALGVSELWRYDGRQMVFYRLEGEGYVGTPFSPAFPFLSGADLAQFIEQSKTEGQDAAIDAFRAWVQTHKPQP